MNKHPSSSGKKGILQLIESWKEYDNRIHFYCQTTIFEIHVVSSNILRFTFSPEGLLEHDFSYVVAHKRFPGSSGFEFKPEGEEFILKTSTLICRISKNLHLRIYNQEGHIILEDQQGFSYEEHKDRGGNIVYCSKKIQPDEVFYGLGDKPIEQNLRGLRFENWNTDYSSFNKGQNRLNKSIPFYYGLHKGLSYGIYLDNPFRSVFDFGHEERETCTFSARGGEMKYYFINGPNLLDVAQRYNSLTGFAEIPPLWALGYHQSNYSYDSQEITEKVTREFRKRAIPCDVIYLDTEYMEGFRPFTWDTSKFPKPEILLSTLAQEGFKVVANLHPGIKIDKGYTVYLEGAHKGYFCKRGDGPYLQGESSAGSCHFPDFTHPEVRTWWANFVAQFTSIGIQGICNSKDEPSLLDTFTFPIDTRHNYDGHPCSHRKAHNIYGMQMARAVKKGLKKAAFSKRPFVLNRSGFAGIQRYAAVWTGNSISTWEHMWLANIQCQRLSISGVSFCGSDIGGYYGQSNAELYLRWLQMSVFHPLFRTQSSNESGEGEHEPWSFGEEITAYAKQAIELRYALLPYLYTLFWKYNQRGCPIILPLAFLDQENPQVYLRMDEFGFGQDILVCPIFEQGQKSRLMYLPQGQWYNYWTDELYEGRTEIEIDTPINQIPFFVRGGTIIPQSPVVQYVGEKQHKIMSLHVYFSEVTKHSELYEDAGDFYTYTQGDFRVRSFESSGDDTHLLIQQCKEGRYNSAYSQFEFIFHGLPNPVTKIEVDGVDLSSQLLNNNTSANISLLHVAKDFEQLLLLFQ